MITKEQLFSIPELKLAGKPATTSNVQFEQYVKTLDSFIDSFPGAAEKMQIAVDEQAYGVLTKLVNSTCETLRQLHADGIVQEYSKKFEILNKAAQKDDDAMEAFVEKFTMAVSSLSIDIQMAEKRTSPPRLSAPSVSSSTPASSAPYAAPKRAWGNSRPLILAVDNAVMFLNTIKKLLANSPYDLHCVLSANEALDFIRENRPDMFLLDVEMPGMNGYDLARALKASGQLAPILFITANSAREYVDKAAEAGAVGMLMKPLSLNQLLAKINENI